MNRVAFNIFGFNVYYYSLCILLGVIVAYILIIREGKKQGLTKEFISDLIFYTLIIGILGARVYYCVFNLDYYSSDPISILKVWEGGLAIHGGIIAGILWTLFYTHKYKVNFFRMTDIMVVSLIIGQAIGRWGNFFNGEAYGPVTTLDFLTKLHIPDFIIKNMYINGVYHQPTFLYESLWCIIGFVILLIIRRMKYIKIGQITGIYFIWYGIGRFLIESLRTDSLMLGNLKMAQIISIIMDLTGIVLIILFQKNSVFKNQYNDKENTNDINF